jgi:hypothetical protein
VKPCIIAYSIVFEYINSIVIWKKIGTKSTLFSETDSPALITGSGTDLSPEVTSGTYNSASGKLVTTIFRGQVYSWEVQEGLKLYRGLELYYQRLLSDGCNVRNSSESISCVDLAFDCGLPPMRDAGVTDVMPVI